MDQDPTRTTFSVCAEYNASKYSTDREAGELKASIILAVAYRPARLRMSLPGWGKKIIVDIFRLGLSINFRRILAHGCFV